MPAKPKSSSSSSGSGSESESPPKKVAKKEEKPATKASKATTKASTKTTTKKRESSPKPKKRAASPARASPKPKKRAQKASPEPKKRKASPEAKKRKASPEPKKRKASPPKRRKASPVKAKVTRKASSSYRSASSSRSPSRPPKRKAREVSPKGSPKKNGEKARPQARSFLGALKAVKANQKDMPADGWNAKEVKDAPWDPTWACGHPDCDLQVCSDRSVSEFFCCGKCSIAFYAKQKPQHGQKCEHKESKKAATKAEPPASDPNSGAGWKKKTPGERWGSYGNGKSYGRAWSQWKPPPKPEESKEQTQGLRAWDDDEPPVPGTNAAKKAAKVEDTEKSKDEDSEGWSKWNSGNWKKSDGWSNWSGGWKSSWSGSGGQSWNSQRGGSKGYGRGAKNTETLSLDEAEERRQKRLERFGNAETAVNKPDKVCHINWTAEPEPEKPEKTENDSAEKQPAEAEAKKGSASDDERLKQIRTGERARSEEHEDD